MGAARLRTTVEIKPLPSRRRRRAAGRSYSTRRTSRRVRDEARRQALAAAAGLPTTLPELSVKARAAALRIVQDGQGHACLRALRRSLPAAQSGRLIVLALTARAKIRERRPSSLSRARAGGAPELWYLDRAGRLEAYAAAREASRHAWYRDRVACAVAAWMSRRKAPAAFRSGAFIVDGVPRDAWCWLVPNADGTKRSRSALWRSTGPMLMIGGVPSRPGRKKADRGPSGIGLFARWQPPSTAAVHKGPARTVVQPDGSTRVEQWAMGILRYDPELCGLSIDRQRRDRFGRAKNARAAEAFEQLRHVPLPEPPDPELVELAETPLCGPPPSVDRDVASLYGGGTVASGRLGELDATGPPDT